MYELCCDMIDLLINMSEIYGQPNGNNIQSIEGDNDVIDSEWNSGPEIDENIEPVTNGDYSYLNSKKFENNF
jgi:hypothetical protein